MPDFLKFADDANKAKQIEYLYKTFHGDMIRLARDRLKRAGFPNYYYDAQDAVHNVFLKLVRGAERIDFSRGKKELRLYMLKATVNAVNDLMNRKVFVNNIEDYDDIYDEDEFFERINIKARLDRVMKAIQMLDEIYSITMLDYYKYQKDVKQIAHSYGISEKAVYSRLNRGRVLLIKMLEEEERK